MVMFFILWTVILGAVMVFAVQRAIPILVASATAWTAWRATYDRTATSLSGFAALILAAGIVDAATNARSPSIRFIARGLDCGAGIAASVFLAWSFARAFGGEDQPLMRMTIICASAGVLGLAFTFGCYRQRA